MNSKINKASGFSMIEVLIAVVVIAIGLMGIASLQASAVANTTSSTMEGTAAIETYNLVSRMRANRAFWKTELADFSFDHDIFVKYEEADKAFVVSGASVKGVVYDDCAVVSADCTPAQMAMYDLREWMEGVASNLSVNQAKINVPTGFPKHLEIELSWSKRINEFALEKPDIDYENYTLKVVM